MTGSSSSIELDSEVFSSSRLDSEVFSTSRQVKGRKTQNLQQIANSGLNVMFSGDLEFVSFWIVSHADVETQGNK